MISFLSFSLLVLAADPVPAEVKAPELFKEIQARLKTDQDARSDIVAFMAKHKLNGNANANLPMEIVQEYAKLVKRLQEIDKENTSWLKGVIDKHGWLGKSLVGTAGAHSAWLLVQHADHDRDFQELCLKKMEALPPDEVDRRDIAYLTDRLLVGRGKKQKYGTQAKFEGGRAVAFPIEDETKVDERRKEAGLGPLDEYLKQLEAVYTKAPEKPKENKKEK